MLGTQRRGVEKPKGGLFHTAWESRTNREIPTFPQPQQQAFYGYISNGSTGSARVTFLDGLTGSAFCNRNQGEGLTPAGRGAACCAPTTEALLLWANWRLRSLRAF